MTVTTTVRTYRNRLLLIITAGLLGLLLVLMPTAGAITVGGASDCDDNAIIKCGAHSTVALIEAYNSSAYVRQVYAQFGITAAEMAGLPNTDIAGSVTKDGKVFVQGQSDPVATGAVTGGRQNMPGSTKVTAQGAVFYKRPPSVSFQQDSLPAFVSMKNGRFQFAVIASCGNAVRATATAPQKQPQQAAVGSAKAVSKPQPQPKKPQPQPVQQQAQAQAQQVTQNVTQNQEVTVNNTVTSTPETPAPVEETVAAAPVAESKGSLPNVGPGNIGAAFAVSTVVGTLGYRRYLAHILGS